MMDDQKDEDIYKEANEIFKSDYDFLTPYVQHENILFSIATNYEGETREVTLSISWWLLRKEDEEKNKNKNGNENEKDVNVNENENGNDASPKTRKDKPILFFLHGVGCSKYDLAQVHNHDNLLDDVDIIGFDWPGCGESIFNPQNISSYEAFTDLDTLVEIAHKTIDTIITTRLASKQKYIIMGHSMGGIVAIKYVSKYLTEVAACYLVECDVDPADITYPELILRHGEDGCKELHGSFLLSKNAGWFRYAGALRTDVFLNNFRTRTRIYFKHMQAISRVVETKTDLIGLFKNIVEHRIPVAYVCGAENTGLKSYNLLCDLKDEYDTLDVGTIARSNHFSFIDNPDEFYRNLNDFILKILS